MEALIASPGKYFVEIGRGRLVSAQAVSCCVYDNPKYCVAYIFDYWAEPNT